MNFVSWFTYNLRWASALFLAGIFSFWTARGWVRIGKAFALWFGVLKHPKGSQAPPEVVAIRLAACEKCACYFRPLHTCGTPVVPSLRKVGCWCYVPESAKFNAKRCYIDEFIEPGYPGGWIEAESKLRD